jgi:class 3 adenylate cyclase/tetratricopeptide (TPR) repeat protein
VRICPHCGQETPEGFPRCANCGAELETEPASAREERKVVTAVFVDLVGSTARAERLDPEDVRAVLEPFHERVRGELERFGGTVEKFIGDAVVALFGAPLTHEDDPERAVRAALAVHDAIAELNETTSDLALQVRIGIATGEALVSLGARTEKGEHTASGDVMNTAARLQQAAPPGGVLVGAVTHAATRDSIDYREAEAVDAKGKADRVRVWQAVAARSPLGVDVVQRGPAPLVGRQEELTFLRDALARARHESTPQLVTVVGVPGIGKSRLTFELLSAVGTGEVTWRQGRCLPYGEGVTFWALGEIVKSEAGIFESDAAEEAEQKLRRLLLDAIDDESERAWIEEHVRALVGLGGAPEAEADRQSEGFTAWRRLIEAMAEKAPLVLVIEDLHWADEQLLDFVDHLVEWARDVPLMVLSTARPELLERRPGWGGGKPNAVTLSLAPLTHEETSELLSALLELDQLEPEQREELLARAGGNPLYAEQYARLLVERSTGGELALPETVHGIIAARLDALTPPEKLLLQDAAVTGKVFWTGCLAAMNGHDRPAIGELLHGLERKEFVRRQRRSSVAGQAEHAFRHVLVREVAYSQIPRAARAEKHRLAAEWIESLAENRDDHVEMLAHHYTSALEFAQAASQPTDELETRARLALGDAAARAFALHSYSGATSFAEEALALTREEGPERARLLYLRALAGARLSDTNEEHLVGARDALLAAGEELKAATVSAFLVDLLRQDGRPEWNQELKHVLESVEHQKPSSEKGWVLARAAWNRQFSREHAEALSIAQRALEVGEAIGDDEVRAHALDAMAAAKWSLGQDGVPDLQRSLAAAEAARSPQLIANALGNMAIKRIDEGELEEATELMEKAGTVAAKYGSRWGVAWARVWRIELAYLEGQWDDAIRALEPYLDPDADWLKFAALSLVTRGIVLRLRLGRGELGDALSGSEKYLTNVREGAESRMLPEALALRARVLCEAGREEDAALHFDECTRDIEKRGSAATGSPPWNLLDFAAVAARLGRFDDLRSVLASLPSNTPWIDGCAALADEDHERAAEIYARIGAGSEEAFARLLAADRLIAGGKREEGEAQLDLALTFFRGAGAKLYFEQAEALLASS